MDIYRICSDRLVFRSSICCIRYRKICKPRIFKWAGLPDLRRGRDARGVVPDAGAGQRPLSTPLKENLLILYIGSVILTSVIEYITGYLLEKVFHNKWWDYSDKPYNIKGYICLKFSLFWGFACTFIVLILHPIIYGIIKIVPFLIGVIILTVVLVFFAIDCGITVATIMKFNERLKRMNEIAQRIHHLSDEVGENIYENVTEALEKKEKFEEEHEEQIVKIAEKKENIRLGAEVRKIEGRMEIERLKEQYRNMLEEKINGHNRLMKAFPKMTSDNHNETLQRLKTYIEKRGKSDDKRS